MNIPPGQRRWTSPDCPIIRQQIAQDVQMVPLLTWRKIRAAGIAQALGVPLLFLP